VAAQAALAIGKEAFAHLVTLHKHDSGVAYLVVSIGMVPTVPSALANKAAEVEAVGIEVFVHDQLDVAVGVSPRGARLENVEVITEPLRAAVFALAIDGSTAYMRGIREQGDTEWSADAVLSFEWPGS
jgi:hypothetical protein